MFSDERKTFIYFSFKQLKTDKFKLEKAATYANKVEKHDQNKLTIKQ